MRRVAIWVVALTTLAFICTFDPRVFKYLAEARVGRAKAGIRILSKAVEAFKTKQGKYPERLKDLESGEYIENGSQNPLIDPWGNEYQYDPKGKRNGGKKPDVWTITPEGVEIDNWSEPAW
jgi:hypothetical protein